MKAMLIVAIFVISVIRVHAQEQRSNIVNLETSAQDLIKVISADKFKTKTYCEIVDLNEQIDEADQARDGDKAKQLSQQINGLQKKLGPEFIELVDGLKSVDQNSKDGQEISSILERLDELCED